METSGLQAAKLAVMSLTNLSRDALHVHAGLLVFVASAFVLRSNLRSPWPWLAALAVACGMEAMDAVDGIVSYGHWRVRASVHDVVNTMFWPTVLALACRYTRVAAPPAAGAAARGPHE